MRAPLDSLPQPSFAVTAMREKFALGITLRLQTNGSGPPPIRQRQRIGGVADSSALALASPSWWNVRQLICCCSLYFIAPAAVELRALPRTARRRSQAWYL
jgi:hypothetical protein